MLISIALQYIVSGRHEMNRLESMGARVAFARKFRGMTQHEVADLSELAQSSLASLESGRNKGCRKVIGLAKTLNVPTEWLYSGETNGKTVDEILVIGYDYNEFPSTSSPNGQTSERSPISHDNKIGQFDEKNGVKFLSWTTRSISAPKTAYGKSIGEKSRFGLPYDYSDTAYLLQSKKTFKLVDINKGDYLFIEPDAIVKPRDLVIAIKDGTNILAGRIILADGILLIIHENDFGEESINKLSDLFLGGVIKGSIRSI